MKHYHIQDFVLFFFCLRSLQLLCQVGIIPANNAVLYESVTPFSYLLFFSFGMFDASWISHRDRSGKTVRDSHLAELILNCCGMSCNNDALRGEISSKLAPPSGCRNSFSSGSDGKATRNDLHRKDWDVSSCGLVRLRLLSNCPSVPQGGALLGGKRGSLLIVN